MSVDTTTRKASFVLNGVTSTFDFTFRAPQGTPTDIKCIATTGGVDTNLVYTTDYTVSVDTDGVGGTVTLAHPATTGTGTLTVYRETTDLQESDYEDYNQFPADTLEEDLDIRTMVSQDKAEDLSRSIKMPITSALTGSSVELPTPTIGYLIGWNATATGFANVVNPSALTASTPLLLSSGVMSLRYVSPLILSGTSLFLSTSTPVIVSSGSVALSVTAPVTVSSGSLNLSLTAPVVVSSNTLALSMVSPLNTSSGSLRLSHNTTNLKITSSELDTIQGISPAASPTFGGLVLSGSSASWICYETSEPSMGSTPMLRIRSPQAAGLSLFLDATSGGQRIYIWNQNVELPSMPNTGIKPTFAVCGDILVGDIVTIESNPVAIGQRVNTSLEETAVTTYYSAKNNNAETDGGSSISLAPAKNAGGAVNDGYININAYGKGSGTEANTIRFFTRKAATTTSTERLKITGTGDVYSEALTDYSTTSTITGWTSITTKIFQYKRIGKLVFVNFWIEGTSNSTASSITLPYSTALEYYYTFLLSAVVDTSTTLTLPGRGVIAQTSNVISFYKDCASGVWGATGNKRIAGHFFYEATI
jgi:hypothetical protein